MDWMKTKEVVFMVSKYKWIVAGMAVLIGLGSFVRPALAAEPVVNNYPFPFYDAKVSVFPEQPRPGQEIRVVIQGFLPGTAYGIEFPENGAVAVSFDGQITRIHIMAQVERTADVGLEVLVDVTHGIVLGPFSEGPYEVVLAINGDPWAGTKFVVEADAGDPPIPPDSQPSFYARIEFEPARPKAYEDVAVYVTGMFPSSDWHIIDKQLHILESYPEQLSVHLTVEAPASPALTVMVPFREKVGSVALGEGKHPVRGYINEILFQETVLVIGDHGEEYTPKALPWLLFERSGGFIGRTQTIQVERGGRITYQTTLDIGDRTPVAQLEEKTLSRLRDLLASMDFTHLDPLYMPDHTIADGYMYRLAYAGFEIVIGQEAALPNDLAALKTLLEEIIEGQHVKTYWISFEREGGFAGWWKAVSITESGTVEYRQTPETGDPNATGFLEETTRQDLAALLAAVDFERLEPAYKTELPVADGYVYHLTHNGHTVEIHQEAVIPAELAAVLIQLEAILDGQHVQDIRAETTSGVPYWDRY